VPPGFDALTLGSVVAIRAKLVSDEVLVRHEGVHVLQWRRYGTVGFLRRYVGTYLRLRLAGYGHRPAYWRIPLEVEAAWWSVVGGPALFTVAPPE
jgi:hypothetical protein